MGQTELSANRIRPVCPVDPFAPIIGILLNHILPAAPKAIPVEIPCNQWHCCLCHAASLDNVFCFRFDHLDAAKLPLNGHSLALFKAKRGVHQSNGVLAMLLRNQAGDFYLAGHDASNGNVRLAQGFKQATSDP